MSETRDLEIKALLEIAEAAAEFERQSELSNAPQHSTWRTFKDLRQALATWRLVKSQYKKDEAEIKRRAQLYLGKDTDVE